MGRLLTAIVLTCVLTFFLFTLTIFNGYCGDSGSTECEFDVGQQAWFLVPGLLIIGALSLFGASALPRLAGSSPNVLVRASAGFAVGAAASWLCVVAWNYERLDNAWWGSLATAVATPLLTWVAAGANYGVSRLLSYGVAMSSGSWLLALTWAVSRTS